MAAPGAGVAERAEGPPGEEHHHPHEQDAEGEEPALGEAGEEVGGPRRVAATLATEDEASWKAKVS